MSGPELLEKPEPCNRYYHVKLVPKECSVEGYNDDIDVYLKDNQLAVFLADVFKLYI